MSDADHKEVLAALAANNHTLNRIEGRVIQANTRISKLEVAHAIAEDRQEQADKRQTKQENASFSKRTVAIGIATLIASYGGMLATILTLH